MSYDPRKSRHGTAYLVGEAGDLKDSEDVNWWHCVHIVPVLNGFYCNEQRDEHEDLECCPFTWLGINEQTCSIKDGYLKDIQHVWAVKKNHRAIYFLMGKK